MPSSTTLLQNQDLLIRADRAAVMATLTRGMAHDFRGPLQILTLLLDPHADILDEAESNRLRDALGAAVERLTRTIERFSQAYASTESEPAPLIVKEILHSVLELQKYQRGLVPAEVSLRIADSLPPLRGIEHHLRHVLLGLIVNAKQALQPRNQGEIVLAAESTGTEIRLSVEDNGPGISDGALTRAFEPFFTTREGHAGLGLTVGRWLTERMEGQLTLEPGANGGIKAVVTLPAWQRASQQ